MERVYNGAAFCANCANCPVVDYHSEKGVVVVHDPAKPEQGAFTMTVEEYNALLKNAKPIQ